MLSDLAGQLNGTQRHTLLGIQHIRDVGWTGGESDAG